MSNTLFDRYQYASPRCGLLRSASLHCPRHGGLTWLACLLLVFPRLREGKRVKEGFRTLPFCEVINEAVPVGEPMLPCSRDNRRSALFYRVHCPHGFLPRYRTAKRPPELA